MGPRALTWAAWAVGLGTTALVAWSPYLLFGHHSPALHLVLNSVDACVALLLTYLLYGRFVRTRGLRDLLLAQGLFLLALAGLGLGVLAGSLDDSSSRSFGDWAPLTMRVAGALLIAASAVVGSRPVKPGWRVRSILVPFLSVLTVLVLLWIERGSLAVAVSASPPTSAARPVVTGHPLLLTGQAVTALCFLSASVGFSRDAERLSDELLRWLGPACALAGFARVNYLLFPSLYSGWVYTGDLLRTGFYLLLLLGAAREVGEYFTASARVAALEERRGLARELHDGVVQEVGYIRAEASLMPRPDVARRIVDACDRALDEARAAVDALGRDSEEPLAQLLHRAARDVAHRQGGRVVVDLDDSVDAEEPQRHALARITREAVSNAIRHGSPDRVQVTLGRDSRGRRLVVRDYGRGFDADRLRDSTGYGMTSMRERAAALPGSFLVDSRPGEGTTVVVRW